MDMSKIRIELRGLVNEDLIQLQNLLKVNPEPEEEVVESNHRMDSDLLSATFILGVISAVPALIKSLADLLSEIRRKKYFTIKVVLDDGKTVIEGAATPERVAALTEALNQFRELERKK